MMVNLIQASTTMNLNIEFSEYNERFELNILLMLLTLVLTKLLNQNKLFIS